MFHKVILADNQTVFRAGAARIIAVEDDFRIIGQCNDLPRLAKSMSLAPEATALVSATLNPDLGALVALVKGKKGAVVVVLENDASPKECLAQGVAGVLYRDVTKSDLLSCLRTAGRGKTFIQSRAENPKEAYETDVVGDMARERLTPKELTILGLLLKGYKNRKIAEELNNSEQVIKNYLRSIFDKTGVSDRLELALFAMHHKLLTDAAPAEKGA